jgi:hypothetical protein
MEMSESSTRTSRVYRMSIFSRVFGIIFTAFGVIFLVVAWHGILASAKVSRFVEMIISIALVIVGVYFTIRTFRNSVCLSAKSIELRDASGSRVLPFDKIKGQRRYTVEGGGDGVNVHHLVLQPNDDQFPRLDIEENYNFDDFFYRWFNALPDLDELDKTKPKTSNFGLI